MDITLSKFQTPLFLQLIVMSFHLNAEKVTINYYLIGCKRDMFGSQPFEFAEGRVIRFKRHGHHCLSFPPGCKNGAGQFYLSTLNTWCCCWWRQCRCWRCRCSCKENVCKNNITFSSVQNYHRGDTKTLKITINRTFQLLKSLLILKFTTSFFFRQRSSFIDLPFTLCFLS